MEMQYDDDYKALVFYLGAIPVGEYWSMIKVLKLRNINNLVINACHINTIMNNLADPKLLLVSLCISPFKM